MLIVLAIFLCLLWVLGIATSHLMYGLIHMLLVFAFLSALVWLVDHLGMGPGTVHH